MHVCGNPRSAGPARPSLLSLCVTRACGGQRAAFVVGVDMRAGVDLQFESAAGDLFYLCGVATPYQWANNTHLAFRATPGGVARLTLFNGGLVTVANAAPVLFTDARALEFYPGKGKAFLTCRNFQFGAALRHGAMQ